jgi:fumarate hydratase subunit beta
VTARGEKKPVRLKAPLTAKAVQRLRAGDQVLLSGSVYTARDTAHLRLVQTIHDKKPLPFDLKGQIIYYAGPAPAPPGKSSGSVGPTTSSRMDLYTPTLLNAGLRGMIGKGTRSVDVRKAMVKHKAIYMAAIGGAGALIAQRITSSDIVAYPELGPEAIRCLEVRELPLVVADDIYGGDLFEEGQKAYAQPSPEGGRPHRKPLPTFSKARGNGKTSPRAARRVRRKKT